MKYFPIFFAIVLLFTGCDKVPPKYEPIEVSAVQLTEEFLKSNKNAKKAYDNKWVSVTGFVSKVKKDQIYLLSKEGKKGLAGIFVTDKIIKCYFNKKEVTLDHIQVGDIVKIEGVCRGRIVVHSGKTTMRTKNIRIKPCDTIIVLERGK